VECSWWKCNLLDCSEEQFVEQLVRFQLVEVQLVRLSSCPPGASKSAVSCPERASQLSAVQSEQQGTPAAREGQEACGEIALL
jgi:hypothetical protein